MSIHPSEGAQPQAERKPVTLPRLREMKEAGEPIVMVTAYDHPSAQVVEEAGVDLVLVGDSAAMTVLGYDSTVPVGMDEMLMLAAAVRRGLRTPFLVGDMPFGSYERSDDQAVENALRFVKEAGCDAVKLERGGSSVDRAKAIVSAGIPVMGHVGLTPQTATQLGGYKAQGKTAERAAQIADEALALQEAGCFAIVFEAVPAAFTEAIMSRMEIPVIGIGAGHDTDGQVLVFHDLLGIFGGHAAKFVKRYANIREEMISGVAGYAAEVRSGAFPGPEHIYAIDPAELSEFRAYLGEQRDSEETGTFSHKDWDWGP
ncbi:MAG TPA: 3-methyl-2-oxobutanoate hydroxymethyltransferase [Solirubrobacterales bacterium]|nr:3-methyl-2-oxobutanoate hydroxymethyltransferase [Solirubrobacterales bacterium]